MPKPANQTPQKKDDVVENILIQVVKCNGQPLIYVYRTFPTGVTWSKYKAGTPLYAPLLPKIEDVEKQIDFQYVAGRAPEAPPAPMAAGEPIVNHQLKKYSPEGVLTYCASFTPETPEGLRTYRPFEVYQVSHSTLQRITFEINPECAHFHYDESNGEVIQKKIHQGKGFCFYDYANQNIFLSGSFHNERFSGFIHSAEADTIHFSYYSGQYHMGKKHGQGKELVIFRENKKCLFFTGTWKNGVKHGDFIVSSQQSVSSPNTHTPQIIKEDEFGVFFENTPIGLWKTKFSNGMIGFSQNSIYVQFNQDFSTPICTHSNKEMTLANCLKLLFMKKFTQFIGEIIPRLPKDILFELSHDLLKMGIPEAPFILLGLDADLIPSKSSLIYVPKLSRKTITQLFDLILKECALFRNLNVDNQMLYGFISHAHEVLKPNLNEQMMRDLKRFFPGSPNNPAKYREYVIGHYFPGILQRIILITQLISEIHPKETAPMMQFIELLIAEDARFKMEEAKAQLLLMDQFILSRETVCNEERMFRKSLETQIKSLHTVGHIAQQINSQGFFKAPARLTPSPLKVSILFPEFMKQIANGLATPAFQDYTEFYKANVIQELQRLGYKLNESEKTMLNTSSHLEGRLFNGLAHAFKRFDLYRHSTMAFAKMHATGLWFILQKAPKIQLHQLFLIHQNNPHYYALIAQLKTLKITAGQHHPSLFPNAQSLNQLILCLFVEMCHEMQISELIHCPWSIEDNQTYLLEIENKMMQSNEKMCPQLFNQLRNLILMDFEKWVAETQPSSKTLSNAQKIKGRN